MSYSILGVDPGFASLGLCVMELTPHTEKIRAVKVLHTKKSAKKLNVLASNDNFRRGQQLATELMVVLEQHHDLKALCVEAMSFPRNASNSQKVGVCWGILETLTLIWKLPVLQASPQQIKVATAGRTTASKAAVREALQKRYPGQFDAFERATTNKDDLEHGYDAAGAAVACLDGDVIKMVRGLV